MSFYKLLARPENYDGRQIDVQGVLSVGPDEDIGELYPNTDSYRNRVKVDSIGIRFTHEQWLRVTRANMDGKFILVGGVFRRISDDENVHVGLLKPVDRTINLTGD